jgi:hypothetical protein
VRAERTARSASIEAATKTTTRRRKMKMKAMMTLMTLKMREAEETKRRMTWAVRRKGRAR